MDRDPNRSGREGGGGGRKGEGELYLTLHCQHQDDFCINRFTATYKSAKPEIITAGGGDSSVVRAPDS